MGQLRPASADAGDAELRRRVRAGGPRVTSTGTSAPAARAHHRPLPGEVGQPPQGGHQLRRRV